MGKKKRREGEMKSRGKRSKEEKRNIRKGRLVSTYLVRHEPPEPGPYPIGAPGTNMTSVILTMRLGTFSEVKILSSTMYVYYSYANDTKFSKEGMNIILG